MPSLSGVPWPFQHFKYAAYFVVCVAVVRVVPLLNTTTSVFLGDPRLWLWGFSSGVFVAATSFILSIVLVGEDGRQLHHVRSIKPLKLMQRQASLGEATPSHLRESGYQLLYPPSLSISEELDKIVKGLQQDFIHSWYTKVSPDPSFPSEVQYLVRSVLTKLLERLQSTDPTELVVGTIIPLLTQHLHDFWEAESGVRGRRRDKNVTESEDLDLAIASKYRDGRLHAAADLSYTDPKLAQQDHLRRLIDGIIPKLLPVHESHSRVVRAVVREILACAVLFPVMFTLCDPDTWNQWIYALGTSALQDRKSVRKLRAALDKHTPQKGTKDPRSHLTNPRHEKLPFVRLSPQDDERMFERFIRSIRLCSSLPEARRYRNEITAQIKRDGRIEGDENWIVYLRRLEMGRRVADQKVVLLAGRDAPRKTQIAEPEPMTDTQGSLVASNRLYSATVEDIMLDPAGIMYFMEYMDRQNRTALVQFWLVVNGLRNPLEDDVSSSEEDGHVLSASFPPWTASDRNDIAQIHDVYLGLPELRVSERSRRSIKSFLKGGSKASQEQYVKARWAILRTQTAVCEEMRAKDLPGFRTSDLFYKYLVTDESVPVSRQRETVQGDVDKSDELADSAGRSSSVARSAPLSDIPGGDADSDPLSGFQGHNWDLNSMGGSGFLEEDEDGRESPDQNIVEAMEAALNDIIEEPLGGLEPGRDSPRRFGMDVTTKDTSSPRGSFESAREKGAHEERLHKPPISQKTSQVKAPSLSSLGLVAPESRSSVFDTELFPEDNTAGGELVEDEEYGDGSDSGDEEEGKIQMAAPGDLGLAEVIATLTTDIDKLIKQEAIIDSLYNKAELTNNTAELRILRKSRTSLQREVQRKELQRRQYIIQESDNSLFGKSTVGIKSTISRSENGQEYALYVIEVYRQGGEQLPAAQWAVARRYSEFFQLHQSLKRFDSVRELEFPRRRVVMKFQKDFVEKRRQALDKYLKSLLQIPEVCRSREFRTFLSQRSVAGQFGVPDLSDNKKALISRLYDSVAGGVEDVLGNLPILDQLTLASPNMLSPAAPASSSEETRNPLDEVSAMTEAEAELSAFEGREAEPFVKPICDLFLEVFELNRKSNWLRGRAVVVVLHQLLGGTIERKIREQTAAVLDEQAMLGYLSLVRGAIWPSDGSRVNPTARSAKEKAKSRADAEIILANLIPELSANVVGRVNAQTASKRLFAACNNQRLNTSVLFSALDEAAERLFAHDARAS